jgi:hypothetical protein
VKYTGPYLCRHLIYFLVDLYIVSPEVAADYLIKSGLKLCPYDELVEDIYDLRPQRYEQ